LNNAVSPKNKTDYVFAYWQPDGYYYPADVTSKNENTVRLLYCDGHSRTADISEIISFDSVHTMRLECNWENKGQYYPCVLRVRDDDRFEVVYDQDGVVEIIEVSQLRLIG
jgi:hypothetical protein